MTTAAANPLHHGISAPRPGARTKCMALADLLLFTLLWICFFARVPAEQVPAVRADLWCVAKNNAEDSALQAALDWACGLGGADCRPIQKGGACYSPDDIQFHASYAFNDYFLRNGVFQQACDFGGTAALTSLNPGNANCPFSSSSPAINGSYTGGPAGDDISGGAIGASVALSPILFAAIALFMI